MAVDATLSMGVHFTSEAHSLGNVPWFFRVELDSKFKPFCLIYVLNSNFVVALEKHINEFLVQLTSAFLF